jgi:hypothetical protein
MTKFKTMLAAATMAVTISLAAPVPAMAQEFPLVAGEYTDMSAITIKDGGGMAYAEFLASEWVANQEFAKSQGWISDYKIYANVDARDGEPDLYLTVTYPSVPDAAENERRGAAYRAWRSKTDAQLEAESSDRAEFRTQRGSMMLQEYRPR